MHNSNIKLDLFSRKTDIPTPLDANCAKILSPVMQVWKKSWFTYSAHNVQTMKWPADADANADGSADIYAKAIQTIKDAPYYLRWKT